MNLPQPLLRLPDARAVHAAIALGHIGASSDTIEAALRGSLDHDGETLRVAAALALGQLGDMAVGTKERLRQRLKDDVETVRWA